MNFSALMRRSGFDTETLAKEFQTSAEIVRLWDSGGLPVPDRIVRTLTVMADFSSHQVADSAEDNGKAPVSGSERCENANISDRARKSSLGQFFTPPSIANFMAALFEFRRHDHVKLLDAGAGQGALTVAAIENWRRCGQGKSLSVTAFEIDQSVLEELRLTLDKAAGADVQAQVQEGDFVSLAAKEICSSKGRRFTHAILNPPYKKIRSGSDHRGLLSAVGLETVNLYSGFVGLALELLEARGELVAIIPRSFCNGPYYQGFRRWLLARGAIKQIHLFDARNRAFKGDGVLQENVILHMERGALQVDVVVSRSSDGTFADIVERVVPFDTIVFPDDHQRFIHIPGHHNDDDLFVRSAFRHSLNDIGVEVSTGPVVDFRLRDYLRNDPEQDTVPLLYPAHFRGGKLGWPIEGFKKANGIVRNQVTEKWLYPAGHYAVVRRFSSKEENKRIVASVVEPERLPASAYGFENHLNVFHARGRPLSEELARGMCVYLNSTAVDRYFRRFNGHTQVNATDLRAMGYPDRATLESLGKWAGTIGIPDQPTIDAQIERIA